MDPRLFQCIVPLTKKVVDLLRNNRNSLFAVASFEAVDYLLMLRDNHRTVSVSKQHKVRGRLQTLCHAGQSCLYQLIVRRLSKEAMKTHVGCAKFHIVTKDRTLKIGYIPSQHRRLTAGGRREPPAKAA